MTGGHRSLLDLESKAAASLGHWQLEATERMPLCTLDKAGEDAFVHARQGDGQDHK